MVATLDPGLAWTAMATVEGGRRRRHPGTAAAAAAGEAAAESPFGFARLGGAIEGV